MYESEIKLGYLAKIYNLNLNASSLSLCIAYGNILYIFSSRSGFKNKYFFIKTVHFELSLVQIDLKRSITISTLLSIHSSIMPISIRYSI